MSADFKRFNPSDLVTSQNSQVTRARELVDAPESYWGERDRRQAEYKRECQFLIFTIGCWLKGRITPRVEYCKFCRELVEDWVDPDWAQGRVCRECESKHEPKT